MRDPRFTRTVIYMCAHTTDGAMGLVINRLVGSLSFPDLLQQLGIPTSPASEHIRIRNGGPVETGRGFVLHTADYRDDATLDVGDTVGLTATLDILRDIAAGQGPQRSLLALGYAGWGPGQLDAEIQANAWLLRAGRRRADLRRQARPTSGNAASARSASISACCRAKSGTPRPHLST